MQSPFTILLNKIKKKIYAGNHEPLLLFCAAQVGLLNAHYKSMVEIKLDIPPDTTEDIYTNSENVSKAFLAYFFLITLLNQFGRILSEKYFKEIPRYNRITIFRHKVVEHWDDYGIEYHVMSITYQLDKPAIPVISSVFLGKEREGLKKEIDEIISPYILDIPSFTIGNGSSLPEYGEMIYPLLESYGDHWKIPERLITILLKTGFPVPIYDVGAYSIELAKFLSEDVLSL